MARHGYSDLRDSLYGAGEAWSNRIGQQQDQQRQLQQQIQLFQLQQSLKQQFAQQDFERNMQNYQKYASMFNAQPQQPQAQQSPQLSSMDLSRALMQGQMLQGQPPQQAPQEQQQNPMILNPNSAFTGKFSMMKNPAAVNNRAYEEKQSQLDQKQWFQMSKAFDPATVSSRSTLGMASNGNIRADRALSTLQNNQQITNAQLGNVLADIAGIYQGGAPHAFGMQEQSYNNIYQQTQKMIQFLSSKPTNVVTPEVKATVIKTINDLKGVNNDYIKQSFASVEAKNKNLISKDPYSGQWQDFKDVWLKKGGSFDENAMSNKGGSGSNSGGDEYSRYLQAIGAK